MSRDSYISLGQKLWFHGILSLIYYLHLAAIVCKALCEMQESWPLHPIFRNLVVGYDFVGAGGRHVSWGSNQETDPLTWMASLPSMMSTFFVPIGKEMCDCWGTEHLQVFWRRAFRKAVTFEKRA
jgi:hypothetical protein